MSKDEKLKEGIIPPKVPRGLKKGIVPPKPPKPKPKNIGGKKR